MYNVQMKQGMMLTFYKPCPIRQEDENSTCLNWNLGSPLVSACQKWIKLGCPPGKYNLSSTCPRQQDNL